MTVASTYTASALRKLPNYKLLDILISAIDLDRAATTILHWVERDFRTYVTVTGVHGVMESHDDVSVRNAHLGAGMVTPDGMPLVYIGQLKGFQIGRVYGPDLMLEIFKRSSDKPTHFLYGGDDGVVDLLRKRLLQHFPNANIVGEFTPPFRPLSPDEEKDVIQMINSSGAHIVWVGLSTPKQELWMARMRPNLNAAVLIGVGAAFDFHAGIKRQAPKFMQVMALEWLFRLYSEPRRLWRRYLKNNARFLALVTWELLTTALHHLARRRN